VRHGQAAPAAARSEQIAAARAQQRPAPPPAPPQHARGPPQARPQVGTELGDASHFTVGGCVDQVVGPTIRGRYALQGINHGKPSYKSQFKTPSGFDVMVFFWDQRDGPTNSGWWFAPAIGSDQVWAYSPVQTATPPTSGWKVPISGPVDGTVSLVPCGGNKGGGKGKDHASQKGKGKDHGKGKQQQQWQQPQQQPQQQSTNLAAAPALNQAQQQRKEDMQKKKMEDLKQKQVEQKAWATIQQVIKKLSNATADNIAATKTELETVLETEHNNFGAQAATIKTQAESCVKKAEERLEKAEENKKKVAESKAKLEQELKEAKEKAAGLMVELDQLATAAEAAAKKVELVTDPITDESEFKDDTQIAKTEKKVQEVGDEAQAKLKECSDFVIANAVVLKKGAAAAAPKPDATNGEAEKPTFAKTQQRLADCNKSVASKLAQSKMRLKKAGTKLVARGKFEKTQAAFKKHDKDKDGMLNKKEVESYAKSEFSFTLPKGELDLIFKVLSTDGKAVASKCFHRLKIMVGIAREKAKNEESIKKREAKDKELAVEKAKHQEKIKEATEATKAAEEAIKEAEASVKTLAPKSASKKAEELVQDADTLDATIKSAKDKTSPLPGVIEALKAAAEAEKDLRGLLLMEAKKLNDWTVRFGARCNKVQETSTRFRNDGQGKIGKELETLRMGVFNNIRHHLKSKAITTEKLFADIAGKGKGKIDAAAFAKFLPICEKLGKDNPWSSEEQLPKLFEYIDESKEGFLTKEIFDQIVMHFMKVTKEIVMTDGFNIKDSKILRRLDVGEAVKILEGPKQEEAADVSRVRIKSFKDNMEGWVTLEGNQGTAYLKEGGGLYKVVKETILTDSFDIAAAKSQIKLKVGDVVEVREPTKKDEASGLLRLKCRHRGPSGKVGWATANGNTGTVFLEAC